LSSEFPKRVYTEEEVKKAKALINKGYKHDIKVEGNPEFKSKTEHALRLIKEAGYGEFLRVYIRSVLEIDGLAQLHEADAAIWANKYTVKNPVDAASFFVQKTNQMKEYLDGRLYYGGQAEKRSVEKRKEFLETLKDKTKDENVRAECIRLLNMWSESTLVY
jgi:hypothetical protein